MRLITSSIEAPNISNDVLITSQLGARTGPAPTYHALYQEDSGRQEVPHITTPWLLIICMLGPEEQKPVGGLGVGFKLPLASVTRPSDGKKRDFFYPYWAQRV